MAICSIEGCDRDTVGRGWCRRHYHRWTRYGDPLAGGAIRGGPVEDRFWSKVKKGDPGECWEWLGAKTPEGYGLFKSDPRKSMEGAHRYAYRLFVGPIPRGLTIDHVKARGCTSRACVNPAHLEPVTSGENTRRGESGRNMASKTHCPQGHAYEGANLYTDPQGKRHCRSCRREAARRHRDKVVV